MLNKCKVNMKRDLENSITNYNESVLTVHQVRRRMPRVKVFVSYVYVPPQAERSVRTQTTLRLAPGSSPFRHKPVVSVL